tara:strand:- start:668 stop:877 length:210 start_codon:yes stop_codon:yes gene_type:complete
MRKFILIILLLSGCTSKVWFKTYYDEVHYYEFRDNGGLPVLRTQNELALEDTSFWNNHELKSIVLKDLE